MDLLAETCSRIEPPCERSAAAAQRALDAKTKPRGSLGRLEALACQIAAIRRTGAPEPGGHALVIMAADHGVATEGVSAYPQEVTGQMLLNFARGGAAINALARQAGARLVVVDMGVKHPPAGLTGVLRHAIAPGTGNLAREAAMTSAQTTRAIETGIQLASQLAAEGVRAIGLGEMGIANTTSASALAAGLTSSAPSRVVGRGTGLDEAGVRHKTELIERALALHRPDPRAPLDALSRLGGFEIAGLCGVMLGAAAARVPVVLDGFIASTAALVAARLCPVAARCAIASHRSAEPGHRVVLEALGLSPLLELELRLGEGTGAALAMPLIDAALRVLREMATFEGAGVTDAGA